MTKLHEAATRTLEAINKALPHAPHHSAFDVLADCADDLRAALSTCKEDLQVEPFAWMDIASDGTRLSVRMWSDGNFEEVPLYLAPPQRKPLTEEEINALELPPSGTATVRDLVRLIEQAHGIE